MSRFNTGLRVAITMAVVVALFWPLAADRDSFPLSTFPMYAVARDRTGSLVTAVGKTQHSDTVTLSLGLIGATDDPLVAQSLLRTAISTNDTDRLCSEIARRVAHDTSRAEIVEVEVVTHQADLVEIASGSDGTISTTVHSRCPVTR